MQKPIILLLSLIATFHLCIAQSSLIRGNLSDTIEKKVLVNASVLILRKADSVMVGFSRTDSKGDFEIKNLPSGKFILLATYPKYADYADTLSLDENAQMKLPHISMILKAQLLQEVIVRQQISSIKLKGDTTEYTADSFRVQPNSTVEDLLKKLPGIQIDKNGQITAQGEKVQKILVDGEEFFGDDPTLITQNFRADMIDKVQVYDKKSDQAAFTGIDDGQRQKTLNLKLKDDKKNGYFGKLSVGAGTDGYHDSQLMLNIFKKKLKLAGYGIISNTGTSGLNWQDVSYYGDNPLSGAEFDQSNGYWSISGNFDELDSWDGRYNGQGFPLVHTGGLHFSNKWNDDKESVNANYKILQLNVNGSSATNSQYILPDTTCYNNSKEQFNNKILRNRLNGAYEFQIDSTSSIKIDANGGTDHKISNTVDSSDARASDSSLVNQGSRSLSTTGDVHTVNSNLLWKKKMHKKGRTISFNLRENYTLNTSTGYLYAKNNFYTDGFLSQQQVTDQYKVNNNENILFDSKLTYTEPLTNVSSLVLNYGAVINNSSSTINSFNKGDNGKYSQLDSLYSNDYTFNIFTHKAGINYSLFKKKLRINFGSNAGFTSFKQKNEHTDSFARRSFVDWYPQAFLQYQFNQSKRLSLRYNGYTRQPTIQQIQPLLTNNDPLNITIGNPALKPSFSNDVSLSFNDWKMLSERSIWSSVDYQFTENSISTSSSVDSFGRRVNQAINVNGKRNVRANLDYGFKIKKINTRLGFNGSMSYSTYVSVVNNAANTTKSGMYTFGTYISKSKEKKYEFNLNVSATYTNSESSIQESIKTKYWTYSIQPNFDIFLPLKFQIHSDCEFSLREKTPVFNTNTDVIRWNAWIGKKFLKNDALLIKAVGNDLLDQNIGFTRSVTSNYITQNTYSTIRRYFLLSVVWNFSKSGTKIPGQNE